MVPGPQIAGLFLAIIAGLAVTAWSETWLASAPASGNERVYNARRMAPREFADAGSDGEVIPGAIVTA